MILKSRKIKIGFILVFLSMLALTSLCVQCSEALKMSNDRKSFDAAQLIGKSTEARDAAVLYRNKIVLAAILLEQPNENKNDIKLYTEQILKEFFPNADYVYAAVDDGEAADILELAYYIGTDIPDIQLIRRFNSLAKLSKE